MPGNSSPPPLRIATALERIAFVIDVGAAGGRLLDDLLARIRGRR